MSGQDSTHILRDQVEQAHREGAPLRIRGGGSKRFYGNPVEGERLNTRIHSGILDYDPTELVLTARAGTPLSEVEGALAAHGQMLGCEPPHFGEATFGGMIASGLAGPRRPFAGGVSDQLLGCRILNGRGEILQFGGRVMKNVAGYDVSRLMAGSLGSLGVILDATFRVLPAPEAQCSFRFDIAPDKTAAFINNLRGGGYPVSASCHDGSCLHVRFSAGREEIASLESALRRQFAFVGVAGMTREGEGDAWWDDVREQRLAFFRGGTSDEAPEAGLWRLSLPPAAPPLELPGPQLIEWNGALRWLRSGAAPQAVFTQAEQAGGSAIWYHPPGRAAGGRFHPLPSVLMAWHRRLKQAFDPAGILNPGIIYTEL